MSESPVERANAALAGLSVGDAFGERLFGVARHDADYITQRLVADDPPWPWTDDTAMALSIVECLTIHDSAIPAVLADLFARRFTAQRHRQYGPGAYDLLLAIAAGGDWEELSVSMFPGGSYGNGAAMRVAPLGAYFATDLERCVVEARRSALPTHAHPEGQAGAIAVAVATAAVWQSHHLPTTVAESAIWEAVLRLTPASRVRDGLDQARSTIFPNTASAAEQLGNGRKVSAQDTVPFAIWSATHHLDNFVDAMWETAAVLGDIDTNCAIVGGIVGMRTAPPAAWVAMREPLP